MEFEHRLGGGGVVKLSGRYYEREPKNFSALAQTAVDPETGDFRMFTFAREFEEESAWIDANVTVPASPFDLPALLAAGVDYRNADQALRNNFDFSLGARNIHAFDPRNLPKPEIAFPGVGPGFRLNTDTSTRELGVYAYGRVETFDRVNLTLGGRAVDYRSTTDDVGRKRRTSDIDDTLVVPLAGLSIDVTEETTLYSSYTEIFQPQGQLAVGGAQLDPIEGRQVEIGAKASWFGGDLVGQAAAYRLDEENRALDAPGDPGFSVAGGREETTGVELSLNGRIYPGVDLSAAYSFVDTDLPNVPVSDRNLALQARYTFLAGELSGLYAGLGFHAASGFSSLNDGVVIRASGYRVFDAMASYDIGDNLQIQVNVQNLLDRKYVRRVNTVTRGTFYGAPRNATVRLRARFRCAPGSPLSPLSLSPGSRGRSRPRARRRSSWSILPGAR